MSLMAAVRRQYEHSEPLGHDQNKYKALASNKGQTYRTMLLEDHAGEDLYANYWPGLFV